jgi:hypothetical protein
VSDLLSTRELADRWGYNAGSLRNARAEGRGLPYVRRINGRVFYRLQDVLTAEAKYAASS